MSLLLEIYEVGEQFGTTARRGPWDEPGPIRVWQISKDGKPVEVTKENTK